MGSELGESMRNAIAMVICTVIISTVVVIVTISRNQSRAYEMKLAEGINMDVYSDLVTMSQYSGDLLVPDIVLVIETLGGQSGLAQFQLHIDGEDYEDVELLKNYFGRQLYVNVVETANGIHLWVGDDSEWN